MADHLLSMNCEDTSLLRGVVNGNSTYDPNLPSRDHLCEKNERHLKGDVGAVGEEGASYFGLLSTHANYRLYLMSYLVTHAGEWFTFVASVAAIEEILRGDDDDVAATATAPPSQPRTTISILVVVRLIPYVIFGSVGGVLADSYDRRRLLVGLDVLGSIAAWALVAAYRCRSVVGICAATFGQMTVSAVYAPSHSAIVPMLVPDAANLKMAVTMGELAWSVMTAVGSSAGGFVVSWFGIRLCFVLDSVSYLVSAFLVWKITGSYRVEIILEPKEVVDRSHATAAAPIVYSPTPSVAPTIFSSHFWSRMVSTTKDGWSYLRSNPSWAPFVLLKFCAALVYGASDVLNVSFSERGVDGGEGSERRLGILFGIGCLAGPLLVDPWTTMDDPASIYLACVLSFAAMALGSFGIGISAGSFAFVCAFTALRAAGSSVAWINSELLLQKFSSIEMLGRVAAVDYSLATLGEALSAISGGVLQDHAGMSAEEVSVLMGTLAAFMLVVWGIRYICWVG